MNIFEVLSDDHIRILDLAKSLKVAGNLEDSDLVFDDLRSALELHSRAEEEVLDSALRDLGQDDLASWAEAEHRQIDLIVADLAEMALGESNWRHRLQDLYNLVSAHFEMEESRIFERLRTHISDREAADLGRAAQTALRPGGATGEPLEERP